ncbi:hypothetical protein BC829DRAFT_416291 [Chytridium lagenaria]|nr:hypothetical protein BC829DRAFT_416291 [Chytridium lagenaria]
MKVLSVLSVAAAAAVSLTSAQRLLPPMARSIWVPGTSVLKENSPETSTPVSLVFLEPDPRTALNITDGYLQQLEDTGTDAMAYLTIYPHKGYEAVTCRPQNLPPSLARNERHMVPLRPKPCRFKRAWRRAVEIILRIIGEENRDQLALVWAPNSGNGYPWLNGMASPRSASDPRIPDLDTNGDGILDNRDNPYTPFYPGDDVVDWVGISVYHYGFQWPWIQNVIPTPTNSKASWKLSPTLKKNWSRFPFYTPFSGNAGESPVVPPTTPPLMRTGFRNFTGTPVMKRYPPDMKQAFWRQFLNPTFLAKYPNFRSVCTFEFIKSEELTIRDFTNFGAPPMNLTGHEDANLVTPRFVEDARGWDFVQWASTWTRSPLATTTRAATTAPAPTGVTVTTAPAAPTTTKSSAVGSGSWMSCLLCPRWRWCWVLRYLLENI